MKPLLTAALIVATLMTLSAQKRRPPASRANRTSTPASAQPSPSAPLTPALGSDRNPVSVRVTKNQSEVDQEAADRKRESTANYWTIGLTAATTIFTLGLIVVGGLQWQTFQATLATTRFLERARFAIENRRINTLADGRVRIEYEAINRGRSVASVTRTAQTAVVLPRLPQPPLVPPWTEAAEVVQAGEPVVFELIVAFTPEQARGLRDRTHVLHVVGRIEYTDVFNQTHVRGFAFTFDDQAQTFHPPHEAPGYIFET